MKYYANDIDGTETKEGMHLSIWEASTVVRYKTRID